MWYLFQQKIIAQSFMHIFSGFLPQRNITCCQLSIIKISTETKLLVLLCHQLMIFCPAFSWFYKNCHKTINLVWLKLFTYQEMILLTLGERVIVSSTSCNFFSQAHLNIKATFPNRKLPLEGLVQCNSRLKKKQQTSAEQVNFVLPPAVFTFNNVLSRCDLLL